MNSSEVKALSSDLFTLLLCSFWKQPKWLTFKVHVEGLAKCLLDYSEYLGESNKKTKEHHLAMVPSRQLATNLDLFFTCDRFTSVNARQSEFNVAVY